jgi:hypothetical protein
MGRIFKTTKYSNYLGEERPLLDIYVRFIPDTPTPTPSPTVTLTPSPSVTPTFTPSPSITPSITPTISLTPTNTMTPTPSPTPNVGVSEAILFMNEVIATGGTIDSQTSAATINFFSSLVDNNFYSKMRLMYPMIGGTKNSIQLNAIRSGGAPFPSPYAYPIIFTGFSYSSSGVTGNGSNSCGKPNTATFEVGPVFLFIGNNVDENRCDLGGKKELSFGGPNGFYLYSRSSNTLTAVTKSDIAYQFVTGNTDSRGLYCLSRISESAANPNVKYYKNGILIGQQNEAGHRSSTQPHIGCQATEPVSGPIVLSDFSNRLYQFFLSFNEDTILSDSEISTLSGIINTYQQELGRYSY